MERYPQNQASTRRDLIRGICMGSLLAGGLAAAGAEAELKRRHAGSVKNTSGAQMLSHIVDVGILIAVAGGNGLCMTYGIYRPE